MSHIFVLSLAAALAAGTAAGCGGGGDAARTMPPPVTPAERTPTAAEQSSVKSARIGATTGSFATFTPGATAVTHDPSLVPPGATATVAITPAGSGTRVRLQVARLKPHRAYGAHLHTRPCAGDPDASGPHYQHQRDPAAKPGKPSVDPAYANPRNEVWLDFKTDAAGAATSTADHQWRFEPNSGPRSLVIHAETTHTGPGMAGMAGPRVGCLTLA